MTTQPLHFESILNLAIAREILKLDARHCMQDMQMSWGNFPGFPGYTFGRLGAAMLGKAIRHDMNGKEGRPDFGALIEKGDFTPIAGWLTQRVHSQGSRYEGVELIERACGGMKFSAQPYLDEMCERYHIAGKTSPYPRDPRSDDGSRPRMFGLPGAGR